MSRRNSKKFIEARSNYARLRFMWRRMPATSAFLSEQSLLASTTSSTNCSSYYIWSSLAFSLSSSFSLFLSPRIRAVNYSSAESCAAIPLCVTNDKLTTGAFKQPSCLTRNYFSHSIPARNSCHFFSSPFYKRPNFCLSFPRLPHDRIIFQDVRQRGVCTAGIFIVFDTSLLLSPRVSRIATGKSTENVQRNDMDLHRFPFGNCNEIEARRGAVRPLLGGESK